jgi:hypothetical protein
MAERVALRVIRTARMSTKDIVKEPEPRVCHGRERRSSGLRAFKGKPFAVFAQKGSRFKVDSRNQAFRVGRPI